MTSVSSSSSNILALLLQQQQKSHSTQSQQTNPQDLFKQIDTDGNGSLSQSEFGSFAQSQSASGQAPGSFMMSGSNLLQSQGDSFSDSAQYAIMAVMSQAASSGSSSGINKSDPASQFAQQLFNALDANGDGTLTKQDVEQAITNAGGTTAAADALYTQLDPNNTGSVNEQQVAQNLPPPPPPGLPPNGIMGAGHGSSGASSSNSDNAIHDLLQMLENANSSSSSTSSTSSSSDTSSSSGSTNDILKLFDKNSDGSVSSDELKQGFDKIRSEMMSLLISTQAQNGIAA